MKGIYLKGNYQLKNEDNRISSPIVFFSIYLALMLFQPEGLGTKAAFITIVLTMIACLVSGKANINFVCFPRTSLYMFIFLSLVSFVTFINKGIVSNYYKFTAQIILFIFMSFIVINKREHKVIRWVFIGSNIVYSIISIRYCFTNVNSRYFHANIIILGASFDPNYIGISLIVTLSLLLDGILQGCKRLLYLLSYFLVAIAVVLTASRGNMIAWVVSNGFVIFFFLNNKEKPGMRRWLGIGFMFFLFVLFASYISTNYSIQWSRMAHITTEDDNGRLALWNETIDLWRQSPVFGNGLRSMFNTYGKASHNTYLQVLVDSGIIGSLFMFGFLTFIARKAFQNDKILFSALCGLLLQIAFLDAVDNRVVWIVFCWVIMLDSSKGDNNEANKEDFALHANEQNYILW